MHETTVYTPPASQEFGVSARDLVAPLFRRRNILIATFLAILCAGLLFAFFRGASYSSRMTILVNRERLDPLVSTEATTQLVTTDNPVTQEEINSEIELLSSRDVLEQVVTTNGLDKPGASWLTNHLRHTQTREDRIERAVRSLAKQLKIESIRESNLIQVSYASPNPQLSYGVLKSLGEAYITKHVAVHRPAGSYEFFANETDKYHAELASAEDKLRTFTATNGVSDPDEQQSNLATQVAESVGNLHQAEQAMAADQDRIREDRQQMSLTPSRSTTLEASASNDQAIGDLNAALIAAETKRTQLALKYDESYPLVREADQEIAQDRAAIAQAEAKKYVSQTTDRDPTYELLREDVAKAAADFAAQRATRSATEQSIESMQAQMVTLSQLSLTRQDLVRESKSAETNYLLYLGKREQERTSNALDVTRIANVAIAVPPGIPVLPVFGWPLTILFGLGAATVLGIGAAYTADYLDPTLHTPEEASGILGIPVVVALPKRVA
jgi:uncharacterized protein involved in exopolysaccharide biosynthesis